MLNPLRLFRRKDHIDDSATAYIEGRATAADEARLHERAGKEPGLLGELDSVRQTVLLLRSADRVQAPRSFALSEAPARATARARGAGRRLAFAPAALAIAAAAGVGLLAAGNLADVVHQSKPESHETVTSPEPDSTMTTMAQRGSAFDTAAATAATESSGETQPYATGTPPAAFVGPEAPAPSAVPVPTVTPDLAAPSGAGAGQFEVTATAGNEATAVPPSSAQEIAPGDSARDATAAGEGAITDDQGTKQLTIAGGAEKAASEEGISLPVWQLQAAFGGLAVLMAGLWLFLRRRLSA